MPFALDLTGLIPMAKADAKVTLRLVAATATIQRAAINTTDISDDIDATGKLLSFPVPAGTNTLILVLLPPPTGETMQLVEDGGQGATQPIISFGSGIHASISFNIIAS